MTLGRRILFAASVSWVSRAILITLGLILIPLLFRRMNKEELGFWFMLGQSGAFLGLMDLGVAPTLIRRIAFARGRSGADPSTAMSDLSRHEIADLVATGRILYRYLTVIVFVLAWSGGVFFLRRVELHDISLEMLWIAWTVMCLSHALGVWASIWSCLLQGTGHVGWDGVIATGLQVAVLIAQIVAVLLGGGMITLACIAALGALAMRFGILAFMRVREPGLFSIRGRWRPDLFQSMVRPALKAWITAVGAFLILKTDQYFIAYFQGAGDIPNYHAAYQLVSNLMSLSLAFAVASQAFISQSWQAGMREQVHRIVRRNMRFGLIVMACGIACLLVVGPELMDLWLGRGHFIGYAILSVFCITLFLETQHSAISAASRSTEDEVFAPWALGAGIINLLLTWWLIKPFGLLGVAVGTMIAQMVTNNWYAVYRGLWRLQISKSSYLREVLMPVLLSLLAAFILTVTSKKLLGTAAPDALVVVTGIAVSGAVCVASLWLVVLDEAQRQNVLRRVAVALK